MSPCRKRRYRSHYSANLALLMIWRRHPGRGERRAYLCPSCLYWHLTSLPEIPPDAP